MDLSFALGEYKQAYNLLDKEIKLNRSELSAEGLLGTAYILKALSLWRISDLEGVESQGQKSEADGPNTGRESLPDLIDEINGLLAREDIQLGTRDRVLLKSLPGLYDHDRGRAAESLEEAERMFTSAFKVLDKSLQGIPKGHPVNIYIRMSQLQTLIAWRDKVYVYEDDSSKRDDKTLEIFKKVPDAVCPLKPQWEGNDKLKDEMTKFLKSFGISWSTASACS
jgi:hypothetical protein